MGRGRRKIRVKNMVENVGYICEIYDTRGFVYVVV